MEDYRAKPSSWYAVGWMPIVDEEKSLRPGTGYDSAAARNMRIHQECWRHFLKRYITDAEDARIIFYGDGKAQQTRHSIGAVLGDQQVYVPYFAYLAYIAYIAYFDCLFILCIFCIFRRWIK
jgi:hypothetical protein